MEYPGIEINSNFIRRNVFMLTTRWLLDFVNFLKSYFHSFLLENF